MGALLYQTLRESIVDAIRSKIFNHEIKSGQRIVELELAKEFHTSRGPIREALRQLENEGIIVYTRNVGCSVKELSFQDSYEVYLLRTNYEVISVRFCREIPEDTMQRLEEILDRMKNLTAEEFDRYLNVIMNFTKNWSKCVECYGFRKPGKNSITEICLPDMIWCRIKKPLQNASMRHIRSSLTLVCPGIARQSAKPLRIIIGEPLPE